MKSVKRINESQLRAIVTESIQKVLKEVNDNNNYYMQRVHSYAEKISKIVYNITDDGEFEFDGSPLIVNIHKKPAEIDGFYIDPYGTEMVLRTNSGDISCDLYYNPHDFQGIADSEDEFNSINVDFDILHIIMKLYKKLTSQNNINENVYPRFNSNCSIEEELAQIESAYENICEKEKRGIVDNINSKAMKMIYKGMYMLKDAK